jgi:hypothetical protein
MNNLKFDFCERTNMLVGGLEPSRHRKYWELRSLFHFLCPQSWFEELAFYISESMSKLEFVTVKLPVSIELVLIVQVSNVVLAAV